MIYTYKYSSDIRNSNHINSKNYKQLWQHYTLERVPQVEGSGTYGTILYSLTGDSIREGNGLLNKICGHLSYESGTLLIREGTTSYGKILCNITQY